MWIFTSHGFISAVQHRDYSDVLVVRARRREHLEAVIVGHPIEQTDHADYRYRTQITKTDLAEVISKAIHGIEYDNFKNSIPDHEYHSACSGVWGVMHRLQPGSWQQGVQLAHEYGDPGDDLDQPELFPPVQYQTQPIPEPHRCWGCDIEMEHDSTEVCCPDCTMRDDD